MLDIKNIISFGPLAVIFPGGFGATATSAAPAFGSTGAFGSTAQPAAGGGLFGAAKPAFGAPATSTTGEKLPLTASSNEASKTGETRKTYFFCTLHKVLFRIRRFWANCDVAGRRYVRPGGGGQTLRSRRTKPNLRLEQFLGAKLLCDFFRSSLLKGFTPKNSLRLNQLNLQLSTDAYIKYKTS